MEQLKLAGSRPHGCVIKKHIKEISRSLSKPEAFYFLGGDPAAPSGTATLLRLSASYQAYPRYRG
jgi:hypothetical protein